MSSFGDFYNKNKKKLSKAEQAKKANKSSTGYSWSTPVPEVIKRGKKDERG